MVICISTVYNSENIGSLFQAYSLKLYLEGEGHHVLFIKRPIKKTSASVKYVTRIVISFLCRGRFSAALSVLRLHQSFKATRDAFLEIDLEKADADLYIVGSDEIWNVRQHTLRDYPPLWGIGMEPSKTIAYAPSVNTSSIDEVRNAPYTANVKKFRMLSARDRHTQNVLKELTTRTPVIVCDPVFLLPAEVYLTRQIPKLEPYLLLYGYGEIADPQSIQSIHSYAQEEGLHIYSFGFPKMWCEKVLCDNPFSYPVYCKNAHTVITSTFHGTVFAILMKKNFAVFAGNNAKVLMLLEQFNLDNRNASLGNIKSILTKEIDYCEVHARITELSIRSKQFLQEAIEEIKGVG